MRLLDHLVRGVRRFAVGLIDWPATGAHHPTGFLPHYSGGGFWERCGEKSASYGLSCRGS
jgi:hypothetical protein